MSGYHPMMQYFSRNKTSLKHEGLAALVVFLVALPLSIGVAVATGASPTSGIISAAVGGIVVGLLSGCPLSVSGPTASLMIIVAEIITNFGLKQLGLIAFLAGIIQLIFAILKLGPVFRTVAPSVIQGMLSAIGVSIFASQFHVMVGDSPNHNPIANLALIPGSLLHGLFPMDGSVYHMSALIGVITIGTIMLWNLVPKRIKAIPPALVGVVVSILVTQIFHFPIKHLNLPDGLMQDINIIDFNAVIPALTNSSYMLAAFTVAFIATAETLLTATAVDQLHTGARANYNQEVFAQATGNLVAGFLGVLPIAGVIIRSAANVTAGAKTRISTILHGIFLLVFIIIFPHVLEIIPTSCFAAILVYTGVRLVNYKALIKIYSYSRAEFIIYLITVTAVLLTNLLQGIIIGLLVSFIRLLHQINHLEISTQAIEGTDVIEVDLEGAANFVTLPQIADLLGALEQKKKVYIFFDKCQYIDHSCIDFLVNWETQYMASGGKVVLELHTLTDRFSKYASTAEKDRTK